MPEATTVGPTIAPKSEAQQKAKELKEKRDLPVKPGDAVSFVALCEWLKLLTEEQSEQVDLYVYRVRPIINRQYLNPEAPKYIDIVVGSKETYQEMSEEYFRNTHGGGKYKIVVTPQGPKTNGFFTARLEIPMNDCQPILNLREVDWTHPSNQGFQTYCRAKGLIDEKNMPTIERKDGTQVTPDSVALPMLDKFMDFWKKMDSNQQEKVKRDLAGEAGLGKEIGSILVEQMKQNDPTKLLTVITTIVGAMQPKNDGGMAAMFAAVMESSKNTMMMMMESNKQNTAVLMELLKAQKEEPKGEGDDELTKLEKLINVAQKLKGGRSISEDDGEGIWEKVLAAAQAIIPQGLALANNVMVANMAAKGVQGVQPSPTVGQQASQQTNQTQGGGGVKAMIGNMTPEQKQQLFRQFSPFIEKSLNDSKEGWEFACDVEALMGKEAVAMFIKDGEGPLLEVAKSVPEVWGRLLSVYGEAHLTKWVSELVNYEEIRKEHEKEEGVVN